MKVRAVQSLSFVVFILSSGLLVLAGCATTKPPKWHPAFAVDPDHSLTLVECLQIARDNDVKATQWRARLRTAKADLAKAGEIPNPALQLSWEDVGLNDELTGSDLHTFAWGFNYPIFFWWTRDKELAEAKNNMRASAAAVEGEQLQLARDIGEAFIGLAAAQRAVSIQQDLQKNSSETLRLARELFNQGEIAQFEVDQAEAEVLQAADERHQAERERTRLAITFAFAMGADRPANLAVADEDELADIYGAAEPTPDELNAKVIEQLADRTPSIVQARAATKAAEARLRVEERRRMPLTEAQGSADRKDAPEGKSWMFGLDFPIPLFNWNGASIRKAKADLLAAQTEEEIKRRELAANVALDWYNQREAEVRYRETIVPLIERRGKLAAGSRELYGAGQIVYRDLLQAERDVHQAQLAGVDAWKEKLATRWQAKCTLNPDLWRFIGGAGTGKK